MEKIVLLSIRKETQELIRKNIDDGLDLIVLRDGQIADLDRNILLILIECEYHCNLDDCLKKFLYVYQNQPVPAALIKPLIIRDSPFSTLMMIKMLSKFSQADTSARLNHLFENVDSCLFSQNSKILPFDPLKKIIEAQKIILESRPALRSLAELAKQVGCSSAWLSHYFKKCTGLSLSYYWAKEKCCSALWQLISTDKPVKTIALEEGYHPLYFSQLFKKIFNMSPKKIRDMTLRHSIS